MAPLEKLIRGYRRQSDRSRNKYTKSPKHVIYTGSRHRMRVFVMGLSIFFFFCFKRRFSVHCVPCRFSGRPGLAVEESTYFTVFLQIFLRDKGKQNHNL